MKILFLRHGKSEANLKGLFAGQKEDSPLIEEGRDQAFAAAKKLKKLRIDLIFSSKLKRAKETAEIIAREIGYPLEKIIFDDRILEYDMGVLTGTPIIKVTSQELVSSEGAESPYEFKSRVINFLKSLPSDKTILIVSHAGVGRIIESSKIGIDPREFYNVDPYPNSKPVELDLSWLRNY